MTTARCRWRIARVTTAAAALGVGLSGCTTFSADGGIDAVRSLAQESTGLRLTLPDPRSGASSTSDAVRGLLSQPLTMDAAVQIALLNNAGLRASFAGLGIAEADLVQAGRLSNPTFSFSSIRSSEAQSIERTLLVNLVSTIFLPLRQDVAQRQFHAAQLELAGEVVRVAGDTRNAWISAVAAQASVKYFEQVRMAAEASAELAGRMARVGNFSKLAHMREQAFYADATARLAKSRHQAVVERERLTRLLGVTGSEARFELPERLPDLPDAPLEQVAIEQAALDRRLDMQLARSNTAGVAADLGLVRTTRFINVLEAGYTNESETGERRKSGYEIEVAIPLFDWGDAKLKRAEAVYMQSVERTAQVALAARSEIRERYHGYRMAFDVARHYRDEIVPLRKRIAEENTLRYNGMLIGVFELIADARDQVASVNAYLEALREFWLAGTALDLALSGVPPSGVMPMRSPAMPTGASAGVH